MPYNLIDIAVVHHQPHKSLPDRIIGKVRAVLKEVHPEREQDHELSLTVWATKAPDMSNGDVEMALLLKAADIVGRVKADLERSDKVQAAQ